MKKNITLLTGILFMSAILSAQVTLTYDTHSLKPGEENPMKICKYVPAGIPGNAVTWDFKDLEFVKDFTGYLTKPEDDMFEDATTKLSEFKSDFYFIADKKSLEQVGYSSNNGKLKVTYDPNQRFVKMKYPFDEQGYFSGSFAGKYEYNGKKIGDIDGTYTVEADATGTLLLPHNTTVENTLRVRTEKNYSLFTSNSEQKVEITTYRWYNAHWTFPIVVLTEMKTTSNGRTNTSYQAAYNSNVITSAPVNTVDAYEIKLYPTEVSTELNIEFNITQGDDVNITIFDINGKKVQQISNYSVTTGVNRLTLNEEVQSLSAGKYLVEISGQNSKSIEEFIVVR
ncbi:MAG: T9SS type A sorting domain-containing protein [Bacteroidales bacterium]|nr:T9SS type A sorting domain-containing protein [Bacteroidales bacterium]